MAGRPEKMVDWNLVDELLMADCTGVEIAPHFDMSVYTFYDRIRDEFGMNLTEYSFIKKSQGDACLRKRQYDKALDGDTSMLIWLGKNRLRQKDRETDKELEEIKAKLDFFAQTVKQGRAEYTAKPPEGQCCEKDCTAPGQEGPQSIQ